MTLPKSKAKGNRDSNGDSYRVLRVTDGYQGRPSRERLILPGLYLEDDPRLYGCADLLVTKGHAQWVEGVSALEIEALKLGASAPSGDVPDGFRGLPPAEGQKTHGLLSPAEIAAMNTPGYEPPEDESAPEDEEPPPPAPTEGRQRVRPEGS